jgi:hypothetical protein
MSPLSKERVHFGDDPPEACSPIALSLTTHTLNPNEHVVSMAIGAASCLHAVDENQTLDRLNEGQLTGVLAESGVLRHNFNHRERISNPLFILMGTIRNIEFKRFQLLTESE